MSMINILSLIKSPLLYTKQSVYTIQTCTYAVKSTSTSVAGGIMGLGKGKKKGVKMGAAVQKVLLPVETDTEKLVTYLCGSNINTTGEDVKLKPDSEYPDWLWTLRVGRPPTLEEMDPNSKQYWQKVRCIGIKKNNYLRSLKKF